MDAKSLKYNDIRIINGYSLNRMLGISNGIAKYTWTDFFKDENELLNTLKEFHNVEIMKKANNLHGVRIFEAEDFCFSISNLLKNGNELTKKQIAQCKRLSLEIRKASTLDKIITRYIENDGKLPENKHSLYFE